MKNVYLILILFFFVNSTIAQKADDIIGYYYCIDIFNKEESQIHIYKISDNTYRGKVVWVKNIEKIATVGLVFLENLRFNEKNKEWEGGKIKYPGKTGTYNTYMSFEDNTNRLKVRGYFGLSLFGVTVYWTKEDKLRTQN